MAKPSRVNPQSAKKAPTAQPKIALVCDWLTNPGGAEKVLLELHRMYPDAPIFTSQYNRKKLTWFHDADVRVGWIQIFPSFLRNYLGVFRQFYFSHLDLSDYDVVISVTGAEAKSVKIHNQKTGNRAYHICYCHVPTQYYWQKYDYYIKHPGFGIFNPLARLGLRLLVRPLRQADYRAAQQPDQFATISTYSAQQIQKYYHRPAEIVYPAVDTAKFSTSSTEKSTKNQRLSTEDVNFSTDTEKLSTEKQEFSTDFAGVDKKLAQKIKKLIRSQQYYITYSRQVPWKRTDLAIQACQQTGKNLLVIGEGPEHDNLVKLARELKKPTSQIYFLPWQSSASLAELLHHAKAYIFPSEEPFGIAAAEALAAGCPVLAFGEGGSRDLVTPGKNGLLFSEQTVASVARTIDEFEQLIEDQVPNGKSATSKGNQSRAKLWSAAKISQSAKKFSPDHFRAGIRRLVACAKPATNQPSTKQSPTKESTSSVKPRTKLDKIITLLVLTLPFALFMSYYPVISLGSTPSMNLELSVPLIWLLIFDVLIIVKLLTLPRANLPGITDRRFFLLALFPLYTTASVFWSANPLRGLLTAGIIWALFIAVFAIIFVLPLTHLPPNFRRNMLIAIFGASCIFCIVCILQSLADICGIPRETTLLCRGCTYQSFGFPHPSGLAIEPQFMGNLLLAPTLLGLGLLAFRQVKSHLLIALTFLFSATLFLTFSRGAIYAYGVALVFLAGVAITKKARLRCLIFIPVVSFLVALLAQGMMAAASPTTDTFVTATTKALHHLSLSVIDLRPQQDAGSDLMDHPQDDGASQAAFSGYVAESTDVRLNLNSVALRTWQTAPFFGVGLGSAGIAMHEFAPTEVTSPKEIVQNQPISLLLELGLVGIGLLIFALLICFCPRLFSRHFLDGRQASRESPDHLSFWHHPCWPLLLALILAYLVSLNFFAGLPNALHIYLMPPLIFLLGSLSNQPSS